MPPGEYIPVYEKAAELFPSATEADLIHFLIEATAFPIARAEKVMEQVVRYGEASGGDLHAAIALAHADFDAAWEEMERNREV